MTDLIRKAVELADGWDYETDDIEEPVLLIVTMAGGGHFDVQFVLEGDWSTDLNGMDQLLLDALAAQLVRQVDALEDYWVCVEDDRATIQCDGIFVDVQHKGPDRTLNTIKAIVDSKVLEDE